MKLRIKKTMLVAGILSGAALASAAGVGMVSAASNTNHGPDDLIQKIAQKFNLKSDDVKNVFEEERSERQAEHKKEALERLDQAVKDGKITEAQKTLIIAKHAELKADMEANRESFKDKTKADRKAAMEAKKAEVEKWATDNNIPLEFVRFGHGPGGPGGRGR